MNNDSYCSLQKLGVALYTLNNLGEETRTVVYEAYASSSINTNSVKYLSYSVVRETLRDDCNVSARLEEICDKLSSECGPSFVYGTAHFFDGKESIYLMHDVNTLDGEPVPLNTPLKLK
jgi:hypothetical protein